MSLNTNINWNKGLSLGSPSNPYSLSGFNQIKNSNTLSLSNTPQVSLKDFNTPQNNGGKSGGFDLKAGAMAAIPMVTGALGALNDYTKRNMTDQQKTEFNAIYGRGEDPIFDLFHLGKDAKNTAQQIKNTAYTNTGVLGSNQDLLNTYNSFDFDSWKPNNNKINFWQANLKNLEASGKGASMGSTFGPWGALIGGIIGGAADLSSYIRARKRRNLINDAKEMTKDLSLASWKEQQNNTNKQMNLNMYRNMKPYDMGGALDYGLQNQYALNSYVNALNKSKITSMPNSFYKPQFDSINYFATGGMPDFNEFNTGGTHEQNPNGGIPQGMDSQGVMNTVEQGETKTTTPDGDYIFSDRLKLSKEECKQLGVPKDSTYAEASKILRKEYDEMPNDDIARRGWEQSRDMLIQSQEIQKQEIALKETRKQGLNAQQMNGVSPEALQQMQQQPSVEDQYLMQDMNPEIAQNAFGGLVRKLYDGGDTDYPPGVWPPGQEDMYHSRFLYPIQNVQPLKPVSLQDVIDRERQADLKKLDNTILNIYGVDEDPELPDVTLTREAKRYARKNKSVPEELSEYKPLAKPVERPEDNNSNNFDLEKLKYAPVLGNIIGLAQNLFTPEDYTLPNRLQKEIDLLPRVSVQKNTNYMTYNPVDVNRYINQYNAQTAAQRNAIMNTSNPNRNAALASAIYNANISYGDLVQAIEAQNAKEKQAVQQFNAGIDQQNIVNQLQADGVNQQYEQMRINGIMQELAMRDAIQTARANAIQSNLKSLTDNMYNMYLDNTYNRQMDTWMQGQSIPTNLGMQVADKSITPAAAKQLLVNQFGLEKAKEIMSKYTLDGKPLDLTTLFGE